MPEPDEPLSHKDARDLVSRRGLGRMGQTRHDIADFKARIGDLSGALARLVTMAGFYLDDGSGGQYLNPDVRLFPLAGQAFAEADKARWDARAPWLLTLSGEPPGDRQAVHAGLTMYDRALSPAWERWGCAPQWFLRDGEELPWLGRLYPGDFPRNHTVMRRELDMLKAAVELLKLDRPAAAANDRPVAAVTERYVVASKADVVRFLSPRNTDPDNTKLVNDQKYKGRLDFRGAKPPVGNKRFEFLFCDPDEHARFERHMGVVRG